MLEAGLIVSRFLHYTATLTLFGLSLFPLYTYTELTAAPYMRRATLWLTALAALLSAVFWVMSVAFSMAGTLDGDSVWSVLSETSFGKVWMARFILVTIILVLATCACRKSDSHIQMMKSAKKWRRQNATNGMYCSRRRRVLAD